VVAHGAGDKTKRVGRTYPTKEAAERAAKAEHGRAARKPYSLDLNLALGDAALYPDQRVAASGFKPEIDATNWLISEVSHTIGDRGFVSLLKLEALASDV
jgi:phage protein D